MKALLALVTLSLAAMLAATGVRAYPKDRGPFADGERPKTFRTFFCRAIDREPPKEKGGLAAITFARSDGEPPAARVRLSPGKKPKSVAMTVLDAEGGALAGPRLISDSCTRMLPVFWADLNGDGREDFIALVVTPCGTGVCGCDVSFALSSERGYTITAVRPTMSPAGGDFVDLGDGRCRFVHTSLVTDRAGPAADAEAPGHWVYNLLEFDGGRVAVSGADARFPRWVRRASGDDRQEAPAITDERKRELWAAVPDRIFRRPNRECAAADISARP
jgi:hypothetical protein